MHVSSFNLGLPGFPDKIVLLIVSFFIYYYYFYYYYYSFYYYHYYFIYYSLILISKYVYPFFSTSYITSLFGSFIPSHLNYFPSLHGKNSTIFHSKLHPNISTKSVSQVYHLLFTFRKQLQIIHEQQMIQLEFFLFSFIACAYLSKYQRQRYKTQNKQ